MEAPNILNDYMLKAFGSYMYFISLIRKGNRFYEISIRIVNSYVSTHLRNAERNIYMKKRNIYIIKRTCMCVMVSGSGHLPNSPLSPRRTQAYILWYRIS